MPSVTTDTSILRRIFAVFSSQTVRGADGSNGAATAPVESAMPFTNTGARYTPPLATVFIIAVICSGVTVSAPCPKLKLASCPSFARVCASGSVPAALRRLGASCTAVPKPNCSAVDKMRAAPSSCPSSIK